MSLIIWLHFTCLKCKMCTNQSLSSAFRRFYWNIEMIPTAKDFFFSVWRYCSRLWRCCDRLFLMKDYDSWTKTFHLNMLSHPSANCLCALNPPLTLCRNSSLLLSTQLSQPSPYSQCTQLLYTVQYAQIFVRFLHNSWFCYQYYFTLIRKKQSNWSKRRHRALVSCRHTVHSSRLH